ncbi:MAG: hypothetical protein ABII89_03070 [Candidatus Omnitrophota bacterium]
MKVIAYSDGERIESIVVFEDDRSACLTSLQNDGYLIVGEEEIPASRVRNFNRYSRVERDERS